MSLRNQVFQSLVNQIKLLPPVLLDEVINTTREQIKKDLEDEIKKDIVRDVSEQISNLVNDIHSQETEKYYTNKPFIPYRYENKDILDASYKIHNFISNNVLQQPYLNFNIDNFRQDYYSDYDHDYDSDYDSKEIDYP